MGFDGETPTATAQYAPVPKDAPAQAENLVVMQTPEGPRTFMMVQPPQTPAYVAPPTYSTPSYIEDHAQLTVPSHHHIVIEPAEDEMVTAQRRLRKSMFSLRFALCCSLLYCTLGYIFWPFLWVHFTVVLAMNIIGSLAVVTRCRSILVLHATSAFFYAGWLTFCFIFAPFFFMVCIMMVQWWSAFASLDMARSLQMVAIAKANAEARETFTQV